MNCVHAGNSELLEKYVSGKLPTDEASVFELHYFECEECLAAVQIGQAIGNSGVVEKSASPKVVSMPVRPAVGRPKWIYPLAAAAALIIGTFVAWRAFLITPPKAPDVAKNQPAVSAPVEPNPVTSAQPSDAKAPELVALNRLEAVDALPYRGSVLRGAEEDSSERFRKAMESYTAHDYRAAATRLSGIPVGVPGSGKPEEHVTDAGIQLYLGVSRLLLDENGRAVEALRRSVQYGDTPYVESAGYYLAKGLIRQKHYDEAAAQLRQTIALNGDRQNAAKQLLEDLDKLTAK